MAHTATILPTATRTPTSRPTATASSRATGRATAATAGMVAGATVAAEPEASSAASSVARSTDTLTTQKRDAASRMTRRLFFRDCLPDVRSKHRAAPKLRERRGVPDAANAYVTRLKRNENH